MSRPLNFDSPVIDDIGDIFTLTEYIQKNGTDPETIEGLENKIEAVEDIISDEWDVTKTYAAGDYYIYNNKLYRVKITGTGFDPTDTEFAEAVTVASELTDLNSNLSWKVLGSYDKNQTVTLPQNYSEIHLVAYGTNSTSNATVTTILKNDIQDVITYAAGAFNFGYYIKSDVFIGAQVIFTDEHTFKLTTYECNTKGLYTTAKVKVMYR